MIVREYYDEGGRIETRAIVAQLFPVSGKNSSLQLENRIPRQFCCSCCVSPLLGLGLAFHYRAKKLSLTISPWSVLCIES